MLTLTSNSELRPLYWESTTNSNPYHLRVWALETKLLLSSKTPKATLINWTNSDSNITLLYIFLDRLNSSLNKDMLHKRQVFPSYLHVHANLSTKTLSTQRLESLLIILKPWIWTPITRVFLLKTITMEQNRNIT